MLYATNNSHKPPQATNGLFAHVISGIYNPIILGHMLPLATEIAQKRFTLFSATKLNATVLDLVDETWIRGTGEGREVGPCFERTTVATLVAANFLTIVHSDSL